MNHLLRITVLVAYSASWLTIAQIIYDSPPVGVSLTRPALPWLARYFVGATNPVHHFLDEPQPGPLGAPPGAGSNGGGLPGRGEPGGGRAAEPNGDFGSDPGGELGGQGGSPGGSGGGSGPPFDPSAGAGGSGSSLLISSPVPVPVPVISPPSLAPRTFLPPLPPMPNPIPVAPTAPLLPPPPPPPSAFHYPPMPSPVPLVPQMPVFEQVSSAAAPLPVEVPPSLPALRTAVPPIPPAYAPVVSPVYFSPPLSSPVGAVPPPLSLAFDSSRAFMRPGELAAPSKSLFYRNVIVGPGGSLPPAKFFAKN